MRVRRHHRRNDRSGLLWTAVQMDAAPAVQATPVIADCVHMAVDVNLGTSQSHATLMRIRGSFGLTIAYEPYPSSTPFEFMIPWYAFIVARDDDDLAMLPGTLNDYVDEDILWTQQGVFSGVLAPLTGASAVSTTYNSQHIEVDVKAKRKLETGRSVTLFISMDPNAQGINDSAFSLVAVGVLRSLLKLR